MVLSRYCIKESKITGPNTQGDNNLPGKHLEIEPLMDLGYQLKVLSARVPSNAHLRVVPVGISVASHLPYSSSQVSETGFSKGGFFRREVILTTWEVART